MLRTMFMPPHVELVNRIANLDYDDVVVMVHLLTQSLNLVKSHLFPEELNKSYLERNASPSTEPS